MPDGTGVVRAAGIVGAVLCAALAAGGVFAVAAMGQAPAKAEGARQTSSATGPTQDPDRASDRPVPTPSATPSAPASAATTAPTPEARARAVYAVQPGDTLSSVSARFGVSVQKLAQANGILDVDEIYAFSALVIPAG